MLYLFIYFLDANDHQDGAAFVEDESNKAKDNKNETSATGEEHKIVVGGIDAMNLVGQQGGMLLFCSSYSILCYSTRASF